LLKNNFSAATLAQVDSWLFRLGGSYPLAPSVFVQAEAETENTAQFVKSSTGDLTDLFSCPACGEERTFVLEHETQVVCQQCSKQYGKRDGIWDFKESLN
jgi:hypothetical protein